MSVNTWKNWESLKHTSNTNGYDGALYDGYETIEQAWNEGLKARCIYDHLGMVR